jgi:hypothetical protein
VQRKGQKPKPVLALTPVVVANTTLHGLERLLGRAEGRGGTGDLRRLQPNARWARSTYSRRMPLEVMPPVAVVEDQLNVYTEPARAEVGGGTMFWPMTASFALLELASCASC